MMLAAGGAAGAHPVAGVGTGGFQSWARREAGARGQDATGIMQHAHSTPGHVAATTGLIGLGLLAMTIWCAVRSGCARAAWEHPGDAGVGTAWLGTYAAGPAFALAGVCLAGLFDTVTVSTPSCVLFWVLIALCPAWWVGKRATR
jgi:O-antigen ligase